MEFFFSAFDAYLRSGMEAEQALAKTASDYAYVYFHEDGRSPLARAAERALLALQETGEEAVVDDD